MHAKGKALVCSDICPEQYVYTFLSISRMVWSVSNHRCGSVLIPLRDSYATGAVLY